RRGRRCGVRDVGRAVGLAPGVRRRAPGGTGATARHPERRGAGRLRQRDHLQGGHRARRDRAQDVRDVAPDAPLPHRRLARSAAGHHTPVPARQDRRGPRRHPRGRRGQDHPGDRMSFAGRLEAELEQALARFVGCEASLTYVSCWNANEGLCPTLLGEQDIVISDQLNHASIIDSIRLAKTITKCQTAVYRHSDMADLRDKLRAAKDARLKLIFTDGVFSMEGDIARLPDIVALAREHDAVVAVDDSHATGVLGRTGRGTAEHYGMLGDADIITSTLGKALGGAAGGFTAGAAPLADY